MPPSTTSAEIERITVEGVRNRKGGKDSESKGDRKIEILLHGRRVDVTNWASRHPGGAKFEMMHSKEAKQMVQGFLNKSELAERQESAQQRDLRELREQMEKEGLFKASPLNELGKAAYTYGCCIGGLYLMAMTSYIWLGCLLYILGTHQAGWVAHDYSHHSVFASPVLNDIVAKSFGWLQGYELGWWKARHNTHHVVTNEVGNDPDIKTSPIFHFVQQYPDLARRLKGFLRYQHIYYLPTLVLLDLYWRFESIQFIYKRLTKMQFAAVRLLVHYVIMYFVWANAGFAPIAVSSAIRGFFTAAIVFSTHYGEDRIGVKYGTKPAEEMSLLEQTVRTSRNISGNALVHFLSGNISYQVEHHLFPMLPRSNLPYVQERVKALCVKHGLDYKQCSFVACVKIGIDSLRIPE